jgi:hypothetical protein
MKINRKFRKTVSEIVSSLRKYDWLIVKMLKNVHKSQTIVNNSSRSWNHLWETTNCSKRSVRSSRWIQANASSITGRTYWTDSTRFWRVHVRAPLLLNIPNRRSNWHATCPRTTSSGRFCSSSYILRRFSSSIPIGYIRTTRSSI